MIDRYPIPCLGFVTARAEGIDDFGNSAQYLFCPGYCLTAYAAQREPSSFEALDRGHSLLARIAKWPGLHTGQHKPPTRFKKRGVFIGDNSFGRCSDFHRNPDPIVV